MEDATLLGLSILGFSSLVAWGIVIFQARTNQKLADRIEGLEIVLKNSQERNNQLMEENTKNCESHWKTEQGLRDIINRYHDLFAKINNERA